MLTIRVGGTDSYDESMSEFVEVGGSELSFEHSLLSLSKWESIHEKPFLGKDEKTQEELLEYIKCMYLGDGFSPGVFEELTEKHLDAVNDYINSKNSATWFSEQPGAPQSKTEVITSELIYYWMTVFQIPFTCETWHLNRLFTLIRICNLKQAKPKKMSRAEIARRNQEINARRKAQLGTTG